MSLLDDVYELGRTTGKLEESTKRLRETTRDVAINLAKAFSHSIAHDAGIDYGELNVPVSLEGLPYLDDGRAGDRIQPWYRVRDSELRVAYLHTLWRNELRVFRADGSRVTEWDEIQRRQLAGLPVLDALERAPNLIRGLT
jgi:hypothetical protein